MHYMFITWTGYFYKDTWIDRLLFVSFWMHAMNYISIFKGFFASGMQDAKVKKMSDRPLHGSYQECQLGLLTRILVGILTKFLAGDLAKVLGGILMAILPLIVAGILARILAGTNCVDLGKNLDWDSLWIIIIIRCWGYIVALATFL